MLQSYKRILKSSLHDKDGTIEHLDDLLFDDKTWIIRYLVVKTGGFLKRERVLISPLGIAQMDWSKQMVKLNLTCKQIEESPSVDTDLPVFRQMEKKYFSYYNWPYYWKDVATWGVSPINSIMLEREIVDSSKRPRRKDAHVDGHLRSCRIVSHYSIEVEGSRTGHVEDFLINEKTWAIKNLIVDTKDWWPDQPIKIVPRSVISVNWFDKCIPLALTPTDIASAKEYDIGKVGHQSPLSP